jgi:hypothetical protein
LAKMASFYKNLEIIKLDKNNCLSKYAVYVYSCILFLIIIFSNNRGFCKSSDITIVDDNQPKATIVIPDNPTNQIQSAALIFSRYINKATGAQLPIVNESSALASKNSINIWIGQSNYVTSRGITSNIIKSDGFSITFPDNLNIIIAGPTDWGTEFGVYEFLEHFIGIKWLIPSENGEYVPKLSAVKITPQEIIQEPAFFSRALSGLKGDAQSTWARRNRIHGQIKFHHNLLNLFPPEKYGSIHPEFFPVLKRLHLFNGQRYLPSDNKDHNWQPCFSAEGIAEEAIKNICDYFANNPDEQSYSLGINDSHAFCQCDLCKAKVGTKKNYLNRPDYSELYYGWANKVVEGVLKKYPDKWFGCLAFNEVAEPPVTIRLNPRIVPFITYDRMRWVDQDIEKQGKDLTERWAKQCPRIGWYDYIYGTPYLVPRVYFHKMADYYRFGFQHGVQAMYAEAYPNWGEGPKLYVALKLQWNPNLDVDILLRDWYISAVGAKAANDLAAYYGIWEDFWTNRVKDSKWFTPKGTYLKYTEAGYLDLVTYNDIEKSRALLESVLSKVDTPDQKKRANLIMSSFEYYEASVSAYLGLVKKIYQPGKDKEYYEKMNQKRLDLINNFESDPVLVHPIRYDKKGIFNF